MTEMGQQHDKASINMVFYAFHSLIWFCLVSPTSAPLQRVRVMMMKEEAKRKVKEATKSKESTKRVEGSNTNKNVQP